MFTQLKNLFGLGPQVDYNDLITKGGIIIDVRTKGEYASGHIRNSWNIPLDQLSNNLSKLKDKNQPVITCCASGIRSASAKSILQSKGYTNVHNGGSWAGLQNVLDKQT